MADKRAARENDKMTCPVTIPGTPPVLHDPSKMGNAITINTCFDISINDRNAVQISSVSMCQGPPPPHPVISGAMGVLINNKPPGRDGEFRCLLPHDKEGRYEIRVNSPEPATFSYRVNLPPGHELVESGMAAEELRQAARLSGGGFYQEEDLYRLAAQITPRKHDFTLRQEVLLWNPLIFILFLALVTAEWVLRKFANLS